MSLDGFLSDCASRYESDIHQVWQIARTPGYHTRIQDGAKAHSTRENMDYALALLQRGHADDIARAHDVIEAMLSLQQTDPTQTHYGIWGWFCEELPQQMNPADWNWADFMGVRIAQMLHEHLPLLKPDTRQHLRTALHHASWSIFRRNVNAGYTNIAIMGAVVCASAGEILNQPELLDYACRRLNNVLQLAKSTGGFAEYNSPTYTRVAVEELERAHMIVGNADFLATAQQLRHVAWRMLAERFHPATGQMAGPHARAYADWISPELVEYLSSQTGAEVRPHITPGNAVNMLPTCLLVKPLPCPPELAERFKKLPRDPYDVTTRFEIKETGDVIGTTWLTHDACVGSVNRGLGWIQQRPMMGYWRTPEDNAVALRLRMLMNGHELASSRCRQMQKESRILSTWQLLTNAGHHHVNLNKPADKLFDMSELSLQLFIQGRNVSVRRLSAGRYELFAGDWRAVAHTSAGEFCGEPIFWEAYQKDDMACVQAVLYRGPAHKINFADAPLKIAMVIELLHATQSPGDEMIESSATQDNHILWRWRDLSVLAPVQSEPI